MSIQYSGKFNTWCKCWTLSCSLSTLAHVQ